MFKKEKENRTHKDPRVTVSFFGDNLDYLREIVMLRGTTIVKYINHLIEEDRKVNGEMVKQFKEMREKFEKEQQK